MNILAKIIKSLFYKKKCNKKQNEKNNEESVLWEVEHPHIGSLPNGTSVKEITYTVIDGNTKSHIPNNKVEQKEENFYTIEGNMTKKSSEEIIKNELKLWGIDESLLCYKIVLEMANLDIPARNFSYSNILTALSTRVNKNNGTVARSIKALIKRADFSKSEYDSIREINKEENTYDIIIALLAFCISTKI